MAMRKGAPAAPAPQQRRMVATAPNDEHRGKGGSYVMKEGKRELADRTLSREEAAAKEGGAAGQTPNEEKE